MGNWISSVVVVRGPEGAAERLVDELNKAGDESSFIDVLVDLDSVDWGDRGGRPFASPGEDHWYVEGGDLYLNAYMKNQTLRGWLLQLSKSRPELVLTYYDYGVHGDGGGAAVVHAGQVIAYDIAGDERWSGFFASRGLPGVRMWWEEDDEDDDQKLYLADVAWDHPASREQAVEWEVMELVEREGWPR